ncbi:MAG: ABC transporter ATP-binding protein [Acetobacteraceae bacterium]
MALVTPVRDGRANPDAGKRPAGRHLDVRGAWKAYTGNQYVVRDVTFTLKPGEFLTLLGPSGSGKTTTLMMVAGFELPDRGEIRVDGKDVAWQPPQRRNFGIVFQGYALFPHMSVLENVAFSLRMRRFPSSERRRKSLEMLEKVGLAEFRDRRPADLSGGQQQRVALARALVFEPDALLLDEPLGALDRNLREALQLEIKEIQRRIGISILLVTHDQEEAMMMSDNIAVMNEGRIAQLGSPRDVYLYPRSPFVASFLGETNLLRCTDCGSDGGYARLRFRDGTSGCAQAPQESHPRQSPHDALVSIRPECIRFLTTEETLENITDGVVVDGTFLGHRSRYVVHALGQKLIVSSTDPRPSQHVGVGDTVRLGWARDDAQVLSESDDGGRA